jgi:superfamily II DNA or RNA helicase
MHPKASLHLILFQGVQNFRELERRICALPDTEQRGAAMEVLAEAYLSVPCLASINAKKVWTEQEIPYSVKQKLFLSRRDKGVDGVLETQTGEYHAYQVKFRSDRSPLSWTEISTFVGMADYTTGKLLITNCLDFSDDAKNRKGFYSITGHHLNHLTAQDFQNIYNWIKGGVVVHKRKDPLPHQKEALDEILSSLQSQDRATVVMACGTGKTMVEMWAAERREAKLTLVLLPSLALMHQILHEWVREIHHPMAYLCVCSDPTVTQGRDEVILHSSSVDFPVTTESEQVRDFLHTKFDGMKVVFSTYHSAGVVEEGLKASKVKSFDLGIFDEAHKTAGDCKKLFGLALHQNRLPIKKRVFFTATPRHYSVKKHDKEGNKKEVFSMDVPEVYGLVVHKLSFAKAVERDIICGYKVVFSAVTSDEVNHQLLKGAKVIVKGDEVRARQVANQLALKKLTEKYEVKKMFTFHRTVASAKSFTSPDAEGVRTHLPAFKTFHVDGTMPSSEREDIMHEFRQADKGIISNARCLTEGVDVPAVNAVAFMATKKSRVDIVQATGRAMRKSPGKKVGYIFLPLYLEQEKGESLEQALKRSKYDDIWDVLEALAEQDEVLAEIISSMRIKQGRGILGFDDQRFHEKVDILAPPLLLKTLRKAITTRCVEVCSELWDYRYGQLVTYKNRFGNCTVPYDWKENPPLGSWVSIQRTHKSKLSPERIQRLSDLGFDWTPIDSVWENNFARLVAYKEQHGDCNVPEEYADKPLRNWVYNKRHKKDKLSPEQIQRLNDIGFDWDPAGTRWEENFLKLVAYKDQYGDCNVPREWDNSLAHWLIGLRTDKCRLSSNQVERLNDLGFDWCPSETRWEENFAKLVKYKDQHGDCNVSRERDKSLGGWVTHIRTKRESLSDEQIQRLNDIGFDWDPRGSTATSAAGCTVRFLQFPSREMTPVREVISSPHSKYLQHAMSAPTAGPAAGRLAFGLRILFRGCSRLSVAVRIEQRILSGRIWLRCQLH